MSENEAYWSPHFWSTCLDAKLFCGMPGAILSYIQIQESQLCYLRCEKAALSGISMHY